MDEKKTPHKNRHQLHLWVGDKEYEVLHKLAKEADEPMSRILRRIIRQLVTSSTKNVSAG